MKSYITEVWSVMPVLVLLVGLAVTGKAAEPSPPGTAPAFQLPPLPYAQEALEPYISAKTMSFHYVSLPKITSRTIKKLIRR